MYGRQKLLPGNNVGVAVINTGGNNVGVMVITKKNNTVLNEQSQQTCMQTCKLPTVYQTTYDISCKISSVYQISHSVIFMAPMHAVKNEKLQI